MAKPTKIVVAGEAAALLDVCVAKLSRDLAFFATPEEIAVGPDMEAHADRYCYLTFPNDDDSPLGVLNACSAYPAISAYPACSAYDVLRAEIDAIVVATLGTCGGRNWRGAKKARDWMTGSSAVWTGKKTWWARAELMMRMVARGLQTLSEPGQPGTTGAKWAVDRKRIKAARDANARDIEALCLLIVQENNATPPELKLDLVAAAAEASCVWARGGAGNVPPFSMTQAELADFVPAL